MKNALRSMMLLSAFSIGITCSAQWNRMQTPNDTLQSVRVSSDHRAVLSIYAPLAKSVTLLGDLYQWSKDFKISKADNGVWSISTPMLPLGIYRYHFLVDGVNVQDPKAVDYPALLRIQQGENDFFARRNVAQGSIAQRFYYSKALNTIRRLHIWTPAGYERSTDCLPVLYLIHGGGDDDRSWPTVGAAGEILDNLMAEGKMKPMIVVMPNGSIETKQLEDEVPIFADDLMNSIIPYIESNYRVLADHNHRALAGLSMGGLETLEVGLKHYHQFAYLWVLSSGWFANQKQLYAEKELYLKKIAPDFNKEVKQLVFTQGGPEDIAYNNCKAMLKLFDGAGIEYEFSEAPGGHTWYTWRRDLYHLAQRLFQ